MGQKGSKGNQGPIGLRGDTGPAGPPGPPGSPAVGMASSPVLDNGRKRRRHSDVDGAAVEDDDGVMQDDEGQVDEVFASLASMRTDVEGLRTSLGTYHSPARTCKELFMCHPEYSDGVYWIDPNQGCHRDAFKVFCNFTAEGETCLQPHSSFQSVKISSWSKEKPGTWYSQFKKGSQFSYVDMDGNSIHVVQLGFLKLLSATARQSFTYLCQNSAGWLDSASLSYRHALRFRGANGQELTQQNTHYIQPIHDGCQWRSGQDRSVLQVDSPQSDVLPLMDVAVMDFGNSKQKFGFSLGSVCFNG